MKILFEQGTPVPLRSHLAGHLIDTAYERGWANLLNGDLLDAAERDGYQLLSKIHLSPKISAPIVPMSHHD